VNDPITTVYNKNNMSSTTTPKIDKIKLPEMNVAGKKKDYPSINDYYKAVSSSKKGDKPIKYQHGLSNYSTVQLGDDRVYFKKSMTQDAYRLDSERAEKMALSDVAPAQKTLKQRKADYAEAKDLVGGEKINEMEQMMRDKLQQRTKTGPFQLRKTFKYFDRDGSGGIDFSEFNRAMELMGFQFTEIQQLALFARYDESCTGEVDYAEFVEKVMESDFKGVAASTFGRNLENMVTSVFDHHHLNSIDDDDVQDSSMCFSSSNFRNYMHLHHLDDDDSDDEHEREEFVRSEVRKLFDIIDEDKSGSISKKELEILLVRLGKTDLTKEEFVEGFNKIDRNGSGSIDFEEFYKWYNGMNI